MGTAGDYDLNWITSVDDHIIEPPNVWLDRLPAKYKDVGPHVIVDDTGTEVWAYEDIRIMTGGLGASAGHVRQHMVDERLRHRQYTRDHGEDMPDVRDWTWPY